MMIKWVLMVKKNNQKDVNINLHGFVDDHVMKKSFRITNDNGNELNTIRDLKMCISKVKVWMYHNRLRMNAEKT